MTTTNSKLKSLKSKRYPDIVLRIGEGDNLSQIIFRRLTGDYIINVVESDRNGLAPTADLQFPTDTTSLFFIKRIMEVWEDFNNFRDNTQMFEIGQEE